MIKLLDRIMYTGNYNMRSSNNPVIAYALSRFYRWEARNLKKDEALQAEIRINRSASRSNLPLIPNLFCGHCEHWDHGKPAFVSCGNCSNKPKEVIPCTK
jgi:hypothetical protein